MQRTFSPEALARREARKAETKARNEAKKEAIKAARQAEIDEARKAYLAAQQKQRDDFKASLSEADWTDLQEALAEPSTKTDATGFVHITNDWLHSVQQQYVNRGWLSPKQLQPLLHKVRRRRELATKAEAWPEIKVGDKLKLFCTIVKVEQGQGDYGPFYKLQLMTHYGRRCNIKTGRKEWADHAIAKQQEGKRVYLEAKVSWISPDTGSTFVLTSRGATFGDLL